MEKKTQTKTMDDYIAPFPREARAILENLRKAIKAAAPNANETIAYGIPTFRINGKNLVHFAALKNHIGFYPTPSAIIAFKKELAPYKQSKGAVQFPMDRPIPLGIVSKIVKYMVRENESRKI